jgi:hypothetical protein
MHLKTPLKKLTFKLLKKHLQLLNKTVKNKMFPHFLVVFQWTLLVGIMVFNQNFSVGITQGMIKGGFKVVTLFHLWMLFIPAVFCLTFYNVRKKGTIEKIILGLSITAFLFSAVNLYLHFVNNFVFLMKATEVAAWSLYNGVFSLSIYRILTEFLLPQRFDLTKYKEKINVRV